MLFSLRGCNLPESVVLGVFSLPEPLQLLLGWLADCFPSPFPLPSGDCASALVCSTIGFLVQPHYYRFAIAAIAFTISRRPRLL